MSGDSRLYSYLRSTWPCFLDALGLEGSVGQYLILECCRRSTLFPVGYLFHALQIDMRSKTWPVIGNGGLKSCRAAR